MRLGNFLGRHGESWFMKTPGPYWLLAASYTLFGISEV